MAVSILSTKNHTLMPVTIYTLFSFWPGNYEQPIIIGKREREIT